MAAPDGTREEAFETEIAEYLAAHGWEYSETDDGYDVERAIWPGDVYWWLSETQPDEYAKVVRVDTAAEPAEAAIERLAADAADQGLAGGGSRLEAQAARGIDDVAAAAGGDAAPLELVLITEIVAAEQVAGIVAGDRQLPLSTALEVELGAADQREQAEDREDDGDEKEALAHCGCSSSKRPSSSRRLRAQKYVSVTVRMPPVTRPRPVSSRLPKTSKYTAISRMPMTAVARLRTRALWVA